MNYPTAEQRGIYKGIVTQQAAGNYLCPPLADYRNLMSPFSIPELGEKKP